jgi:hypothetical protein
MQMYLQVKRCLRSISCCSSLLVLVLFPTVLIAAPKDKGLSASFIGKLIAFLKIVNLAARWVALAIGTMVGIAGVIIGTAKEDNPDAHRRKERLKKIGTDILIWALITIGAIEFSPSDYCKRSGRERQVLLIHPAELIVVHSGDVTLYEIESYLKAFLTSEKEYSRIQVRKKLYMLYSKAPKQLKARIRYMQEVLEYAPQKLRLPKEEQQKRLQALQESLSLQSLSSSPWKELRYFLSNHMYEFAVVGALLGIVIFLLSLHFSGEWS